MGSAITIETLEQIDRYLHGELSENETIAFEELIANDVLLQDEVRIQKHLFAIHGKTTKNSMPQEIDKEAIQLVKEKLKTEELQTLSNKIRKAGQAQITATTTKKRKKNYLVYAIAASIAIVFTTTLFLVNTTPSLDTYYQENVNWEELPSFVTKGANETSFDKAETLFKKKEYNNAIATFKTIATNNELYPYSLFYIGASYEQLNENEKALETFDSITKLTTFEEYSKGYWYKLLVYLKMGNREKAIEMKTLILKDKTNYNYNKVVEMKLE